MRQSQPNPRRASYSAPYVPFATVRDGADSVERRTGPAMGAWNRAALDLSNCGLRIISPRLATLYGPTLTELHLQKNELKALPGPIVAQLPNLQVLDVSYNALRVLPPQLGHLRGLRDLNVSCNQLTELPLPLFARLCYLSKLNADGNPLAVVPVALMQGGAQGFFRFACDNMQYPSSAPDRTLEMDMPESVQDALLRDGSHAKLSVVCYNVLAECYATPERHPYTPSWALLWEYRKVRILAQLVYLSADVICLQEVETCEFRDFFVPSLGAAGYEGVFQPKSRARTMGDVSHVDGCAIFWKRAVLGLVEKHVVEFQSLASERQEEFAGEGLNRLILKDNVALVTLLEYWSSAPGKSSKVLVANTHIHWNPEFSDVKLVQTQLFLEKLSELRARYSLRQAGKVPLVIAGDFNSTPDSGVFSLIAKGRVEHNHPELRNLGYGRYAKTGMSHDLDLLSCYANKALTYTNYTYDFRGVLDYVFVTRDSVHAAAVLMPLSEAQLSEHCPGIPNANTPSDHVLLYVQLLWCGTLMSFVHPVIPALETLDRSRDNYQERRVKLINKYTHTIDPVVEVDSEDEEDSDEEQQQNLNEIGAGMTQLFQELAREAQPSKPGRKTSMAPNSNNSDLPSLLRSLAEAQQVLKSAPALGPQLSDDERALLAAVQEADVAEVQRLLQVPGRVNLELAHGDTLLHVACRSPVDRVVALIARGKPDLNARNERGRTPLHELAAHGGPLVILGSLVKLGADPWARDHLGKLAADYIASEQVAESFAKWLAAHNYVAPSAQAQKLPTTDVALYTKSGKRVVVAATTETTVEALLADLPSDLRALQPFQAHLTLMEYRRKVGDSPAKLTFLQGAQRVLELVATWREDPCGPNPVCRLLLVPNAKTAPRELLELYEKAGFGNVIKK